MPAPALRIPLSLNMEDFNQNIQKAKSVTGEATQFIAKKFVDMNASLIATQGAAGGAVLGLRSVLGVLGPLALAVSGIVGVFKLMGYATELAKDKIEEFNEIADKAAKANVSTDFFQRYTKSADALKLSTEDAIEALNRFNAVSKDALGGSQLQQQVTKLQGYGNFSGNEGVPALANAPDTESKLRSTVKLIDEALEKGERLAGLDIAEKAFGSKVAANLRQDSAFLDQMLSTADKLSASKIISDDQVAQAIQLKTRLEDAEKVLAERFKPIQDDLAKLGVQYHQSWIEVVETMASAVGKATQLYDAIKSIPGVMADLGNLPFWTKLAEATDRLGLISKPAGMIMRGEEGFADPAGFAALRSQLGNPGAVRRAMQQTTDVQTAVRGDKSKPPPPNVDTSDAADAYDRAIESITKHTARLEADTKAVGLGAGALEEFRARSQLTSAALQAGIPVTAELTKKIGELSKAAGIAGEALAKARVAGEIQFGQRTAFLSQEDVEIAQRLQRIYGNNVPEALNSSYAAAMRLTDATREISGTISTGLTSSLASAIDGTKTAKDAFADFGKTAIRAIEETIIKLAIVGPIMRGLQSGLGGVFGFADGGEVAAAPKYADGGVISGPGGPRSDSIIARVSSGEFIVNAGATSKNRDLLEAINRGLPGFADGGVVSSQSFVPADIAPRAGGGKSTITFNDNAGVKVETQETVDGRGNRDISITIDQAVAKQMSRPGSATRGAMRNNFGAQPVGVRR